MPAGGGTSASATAIDGVVMVGDSLTEGATVELESAIGDAGIALLRIDGATGRRITVGDETGPPSGVTAIGDAVAAGLQPSVWVIALGTNDATLYPADQHAATISELLQALPADGAAVAWVNVYLRDFPDEAAAFNEALALALDERPFALVCDWAAAAAKSGLVAADGVHLTSEGSAAFATMIVDSLDRLR